MVFWLIFFGSANLHAGGKPFVLPHLSMDMVWIPSGNVVMGSPTAEPGHQPDEVQHEVQITSAFWMGCKEVTQGQYQTIMGENPSKCKGKTLPVEKVTWLQATEFCLQLTKREQNRTPAGFHFRLPTEVEWEYCCRAGSITVFSYGNTLSSAQANIDGTLSGDSSGVFRKKTVSGGQFTANKWGLYDMHGNVREWCYDWYWDYKNTPVQDPIGPARGTYRIIRGGGWLGGELTSRSADRMGEISTFRSSDLGFRIVLVQKK